MRRCTILALPPPSESPELTAKLAPSAKQNLTSKPAQNMNIDNTTEDSEAVSRLPLKALGLRTGMALQTRRLVEGASKKESQFFGAIENKGVMVGPIGSDGEETGLTSGDICVVRGFTGQYEFSFLSKVLQTFEKPFIYALLAYPAQVDARLVRKSLRTKVSWPCMVELASGAAGAEPRKLAVTLIDLSLAGAMIKTETTLGSVGDLIGLYLEVTFEGESMPLKLSATICHSNKASYEAAFFVGMAFKGLSKQDKLVLHYGTQAPQAMASGGNE